MSKKASKMPFVSICTPTFNRRPFIPYMIKCFENQTYPKSRMEWIIIDDGTDKIEDLVKHIPQVKYFKYDTKMTLGKKRNVMHDKSCGSILVYMDDDDYYPCDRVSHAVEVLTQNPNALCAGSSEMYLYFKHIQKMYQFGPYGPNHATAATFAFRRKLLDTSRYDENASLAEEKSFLKDYTVPFVQLDPMKCILVFSHIHNTFDKKILLEEPNPMVKESAKTVDDFVKEADLKQFYMEDVNLLLDKYEPGSPIHKPDVLKQIDEIKAKREKMKEDHAKLMQQEQVQRIIQQYENHISQMNGKMQELEKQNTYFKGKIEYLETKMKQLITQRIEERKDKAKEDKAKEDKSTEDKASEDKDK